MKVTAKAIVRRSFDETYKNSLMEQVVKGSTNLYQLHKTCNIAQSVLHNWYSNYKELGTADRASYNRKLKTPASTASTVSTASTASTDKLTIARLEGENKALRDTINILINNIKQGV